MTDVDNIPSNKEMRELCCTLRIAYRAVVVDDLSGMAELPASALNETLDALEYAAERFNQLVGLCTTARKRILGTTPRLIGRDRITKLEGKG